MKFNLILFLLLLSTNITFSQKTTGTPEDVVKIALTALTNGDIDTLIKVTENHIVWNNQTLSWQEMDKSSILEISKEANNISSWKHSFFQLLISNKREC